MLRNIISPLLFATLLFSLVACNKTEESKTASADTSSIKSGPALMKEHSCVSCHKMEGKQVGPGYKEIALKYKEDATAEDKLIAKVTTGGAGVWGTMPMPPMSKANPEDIKVMVTYILSLAK